MRHLTQGILISIEGIDGSGKSTLAKNLAQLLLNDSFSVLLTREPGATPLGQQLRTVVQEKKVPLCPKAEYLLFAADRAQHFEQVIVPNLQEKKLIISDRMADSSLVYQGYGRGLDSATIKSINAFAMNSIQPDLTLYVRVSVDTALERIAKRNMALTSFEQEKRSFIERLKNGFDEIFATHQHCIILDGEQSMETVTSQAYKQTLTWIHKNKLRQ